MRRGPIVRLLNSAIGAIGPQIERFRTSNLHSDLAILAGQANIILDVGANVGQSAASFSALFPHASIISIEPLASACRAIQSLGLPRVEVIEAAVGAKSGAALLHVNADSQTSSLMVPNATGRRLFGDELTQLNEYTVKVITLDDLYDSAKFKAIDVLKIDTQGSELAVLQGAVRTLRIVKVIQVEANFTPQYDGSASFGDVDCFLRAHGFHFYNMYQLWRDSGSGRLIFANCLYFRPPDIPSD